MKCLSIKQPFAELVVQRRRTIEIRTWNTKFRGEFLVHASQRIDKEICKLYNIDPSKLIYGAIIGKAFLYDVKEYKSAKEFLKDKNQHLATVRYAGHKYGFLLRDAKRLEKPVYMPGRLNFFNVEIANL